MKFETKSIHVGQEPDPVTGSVIVPIYATSTYVQETPGRVKTFDYARVNTPTKEALETSLAALEEGNHGLVYASGLAAIQNTLFLLKKGDHVVVSDDVYGGTRRLFQQIIENYGLEFSFVDMTDLQNIENAFRSNTKMVWIETPTNPLMKIIDIKKLSALAHNHNALSVVDNTFMSPYFQKPLKLDADIVVHSLTKYINGHSDVVAGAIVLSDDELHKRLQFLQYAVGAVTNSFDAWLVLRGIKTLGLRMKQHEYNAKKVAEFLESHDEVNKVIYPGLKSHPQHEIAKNQMTGFGGMISFEINGGFSSAKPFLENLRVFLLAESLGGVESLASHPASMTHASVPKDIREKLGLTDGLIRLSVGIEHIDDLIEDLDQALKKI